MRLKKIIISGFKSFVDHTTLTFPANVIGIVGPNGCGKSNVIDAIRWVMGESSAKTLRGESMSDVIFNGSAARKPVGRATVELVFDNQRGRAPGIYAQYAEISVKRSLSRDGQSDYILNHNKVRRRDITDLFLGTGLGPRSYSIIEQGMVSRIIEAKPEDLRTLVEEAAGISRYKERRRETDSRIRHTRENLQRIEDIRQELASHLRKLKRQANAAHRYKELKKQQRRLRAQLLALQWQCKQRQIILQEQELGQIETTMQEAMAKQRATEAHIEAVRTEDLEAQELYHQEQKTFYSVGSEISKLEQQLQYLRQTLQTQQQELHDIALSQESLNSQQQAEHTKLESLQQQFKEVSPALAQLAQQIEQATQEHNQNDTARQCWQQQWQQYSREAAVPLQQVERHTGQIQALQRQLQRSSERQQRLQAERVQLLSQITNTDATEQLRMLQNQIDTCKMLETALESAETQIRQLRVDLQNLQDQRDILRNQLHGLQGRQQILQELQATARDHKDQDLQQWLESQGLSHAHRLADSISVRAGWEQAADQVLGERLGAILVDNLDELTTASWAGYESAVTFIEKGQQRSVAQESSSLLNMVSCAQTGLMSLLAGIQHVANLSQALQQRIHLKAGQSLITPEGVWVGANWLRYPATSQAAGMGILGREAEIQQLNKNIDETTVELAKLEQQISSKRTILDRHEKQQVVERQRLRVENEARSQLQNTCSRQQAQLLQLDQRQLQVDRELAEIDEQSAKDQADLVLSESSLQDAQAATQNLKQQQQSLLQQRDSLQIKVNKSRKNLDDLISRQHQKELKKQQIQSLMDAAIASLQRRKQQQQHLTSQQQQLQDKNAQLEPPIAQMRTQIEVQLQQRLTIEARLQQSKQKTSTITDQLHHLELERSRNIEAVEKRRQRLEDHRLQLNADRVRNESLVEQIHNHHQELQALLDKLPEDFDESNCQQQLDTVSSKMDRLGKVNLVAIDEFEEDSKRKEYYDSQSEDLHKALEILSSVMHKIDQETRQRFKQTFEALDQQYQHYFPQLFGAGKAHLELSDDDLLSAGVRVMAQPPGKRNSTIHLLSGGEKALAAVALIFAFFELNPAPFCVLDEVDAPLDDANVGRFCQALSKIAEQTQLLFISHNKISMESADVLIGVTMSEAGVSRLVSVDIEQAIQMAATA